jgi:hypothetical protein
MNIYEETLRQQFLTVQLETTSSHVMQFGNLVITVSYFLFEKHYIDLILTETEKLELDQLLKPIFP